MSERMDAVTARRYKDRDGNPKTAWTRVGSAWPTSNGWSITFDALPIPALNDKGEMECRVLLMPPREDNRAPAPRSGARAPAASAGIDDDIPFAPEWRG